MARRAEPVHLRGDGTIGVTNEQPTTLAELFLMAIKPEWHRDAACREHPELNWFPGQGDDTAVLKRVCAGCLVRHECAEAGSREAYGIWAGMAPKQRRRGSRSEPDAA